MHQQMIHDLKEKLRTEKRSSVVLQQVCPQSPYITQYERFSLSTFYARQLDFNALMKLTHFYLGGYRRPPFHACFADLAAFICHAAPYHLLHKSNQDAVENGSK